jgi:gliding motility-associated-like protein
MKQIIFTATVSFLFSVSNLISQTPFWVETFGTGCNSGTLADNFVSSNGTWSVTQTGFNGGVANVWYVSAEENGEGVGNCGAGCGTNPTLHIGSTVLGDLGASYLSGGSILSSDATTDIRAESPTIDCTNQCEITLSFEYIENGDGTLDNHILWYFDGTTWSVLDDTPKTPTATCFPQGEWSQYSITLPASADNNPNVQIGFQWVNNDDDLGTDPSIAIYNIQMTSGDTEPPVLTCPTEVNVYIEPTPSICEGLIPDVNNLTTVTATDNCTAASAIILSQDVAAGGTITGHLSTQDVEVTAIDAAGNESTCIITLIALDTVAPVMTCPTTQQVYADNDCQGVLGNYISLATIEDNCSDFSDLLISQSPISGAILTDDVTVEITAIDEVGNSNSCSFLVEFLDTISPVVTCPSNQMQGTQAGACDTLILDYTNQIIWSDNCTSTAAAMTFTQAPDPLEIVAGVTNVIITASDESGNSGSCSFTLTVVDTEAPSITCPANQEQEANSTCNINLDDYTGDAVATDNCSNSSNITITQSPAIGSVHSGAGNTVTVTLTATDEASNFETCNFTVEIIDTTSPSLTCPANTIVNPGANCEYEMIDFTNQVGATDNCSAFGDITITQSIPVGTILNSGTTPVEMIGEDENNNTSSCFFEITVEDTEAPAIIECAENDTVTADANCMGIVGDYVDISIVLDNCDDDTDLIKTQSPAVGTVISENTTVTLFYEDQLGNQSSCTMEVIIIDEINPNIICPSEFVVTVDAACNYDAPDLAPEITGTDNCSDFADMTIEQNPLPGATMNGSQTIEVRLIDEAGNEDFCTVTIIPNDLIPPTIDCPSDQTVVNGSDCEYEITDYTFLAVANDNCPGFTVTQFPVVGTEIGTGTTEVTLIVSDIGSNEVSCTFDLLVTEDVLPTITCPDPVQTCDPVVIYDAPVGADNCGVFTIDQVDGTGFASGDEYPTGITIQSFQITDASGNISACSFVVEVLPSPSQAEIITADVQLCDSTTYLIEAVEPTIGTGEWSLLQGNGSFNNENATTTGVNNLGYTQNLIVWEVSTEDCGSSFDTLSITVFQLPDSALTQGTLYMCFDTLINISGNTPLVGSASWSSADTLIQFLNSNSVNTVAYNLAGGWNTLIYEISNGVCPSSTATLDVFYNKKPVIAQNDTTICLDDNSFFVNVEGDPIGGVNTIWYFIQGGGDIMNNTGMSTNIFNLRADTNIIVYGQVNNFCGAVTDTIKIIVEVCGGYDPLIPTVITPNGDGMNDLFIIENLHLLYPESDVKIVNRWGSLVFESTGYEEPWNGTLFNSGNELPLGTYFYHVILNDGADGELKGPISIIR